MPLKFVAGLVLCLCLCLTARAQAKQVCGWLVETNKPDNEHMFDLWLQADGEMDFLYKIGGEGVVTDSSHSHSPSSGTFVLHAGKAEKPWGFGTTLNPPAKIDISIELHQNPADIFSDAPTPLLAKFSFRRDVPESEKKAPPTLAKKQCTALK
jgi:hypothetical protein